MSTSTAPTRVLRAVPGPAVGVTGFGRCGSTMTMSMLIAGGCPPAGSPRPPYEHNPAAVAGRDLGGHCIKLLHGTLLAEMPNGPTRSWRFVWLDRDPAQQARSVVKFLRGFGVPVDGDADARFAASYGRDRPALLGALRTVGPVLVLDYERVLAQPRKAAKLLRREVWPALDVDAAASAVHVRDGACRADLAVELAMGAGGEP